MILLTASVLHPKNDKPSCIELKWFSIINRKPMVSISVGVFLMPLSWFSHSHIRFSVSALREQSWCRYLEAKHPSVLVLAEVRARPDQVQSTFDLSRAPVISVERWSKCCVFMLLSSSELSEAAYEKLVDVTLDGLADYFEDLTDAAFTGPDYDVVFSVSLLPARSCPLGSRNSVWRPKALCGDKTKPRRSG